MLNPVYLNMLKNLEDFIRGGTLTPAECVEEGTLVCLSEKTPFGLAYHQWAYTDIPETHRSLFTGRKKGYEVGAMKILAVFDLWEPAFNHPCRVPPTKKLVS